MTPKSKATLEALHALFAPAPATVYLATVAEPVTIPDNLDAQISADEATSLDTPMFRWYRGTDAKGIVRVFRFQRGHTLAQWREQLTTQQLCSVSGPFRTVAQAQAAASTRPVTH